MPMEHYGLLLMTLTGCTKKLVATCMVLLPCLEKMPYKKILINLDLGLHGECPASALAQSISLSLVQFNKASAGYFPYRPHFRLISSRYYPTV